MWVPSRAWVGLLGAAAVMFAGCATGDGPSATPVADPGMGAEDPAAGTPDDNPDPAMDTSQSPDGRLVIEAPANGAVLGAKEVDVTGSFQGEASEVTVNGSSAPVTEGRFEATVTLEEGPATITAKAGDLQASVEVRVDTTAPAIHITEPTPGAFIEGDSLHLAGRVEDAGMTVLNLKLDGERLPLETEDGRFEATYSLAPGGHRLRLRARDAAGNESTAYTSALVGQYSPIGTLYEEALSASLGSGALDELERAGEDQVAGRDFESDLKSLNPVISAWYGTVRVTGENHRGDPNIELKTTSGMLTPEVSLDDLVVDFNWDFPWPFGASDGSIEAATLTAIPRLRVEAADANTVRVTLVNTEIRFEDFHFYLDAVPGDFEDRIREVKNYIRGQIKTSLRNYIRETVPSWLDGSLDDLPTRTNLFLGLVPVELESELADIQVHSEGLRALLDVAVRPQDPMDDDRAARAPGSILLDRGPVPRMRGDDFSAAAALDILNAAGHIAWQTGAFNMRMESSSFEGAEATTVDDLATLMPSLEEVAPKDTAVAIATEALLPPVVTPKGDDLEMHAPDVRLRVLAPVEGEDRHLLTLSLSLRAPLRMGVTDDAISSRIGELDYTIDAVSAPEGLPERAILHDLINPYVEDASSSLLELAPVPLPSPYGFSLEEAMVGVEGRYVTFDAELSYEESSSYGGYGF